MNTIIVQLIYLIARYTLGTGILDKVKLEVDAWADKQISGLEKKEGVRAALEKEGLYLAERAFNRAIEFAVILLEHEGDNHDNGK